MLRESVATISRPYFAFAFTEWSNQPAAPERVKVSIMQDHERLIQELRSLADDPSSSAWDSICELLDELDQIDSASVSKCLPALQETLTAWPDSLRVCPMGWCEDFVSGVDSPKLSIVRQIESEQMCSLSEAGSLYTLIKSPHLRYLTTLDLSCCNSSGGIIEDRWANDDLPMPAVFQLLADRADVSLSAIDLCLDIDLEQLKVLIESKTLSQCRHLGLECAGLNADRVVEELTRSDCPLLLESLNLNCTGLGSGVFLSDSAFNRFVESSNARNLKSLRLAGTDLTVKGIESLAQSPNCRELEELDISFMGDRETGDGTIEKLAASHYLKNLKRLICVDSGAGDVSAKLIAETRSLGEKLNHLKLNDGAITAAGAAALADSEFLKRLVHLDLCENQSIGDSGCLSLAEAPWMRRLEHINLNWVGMTNVGLSAILQSLEQPTFLDLGRNELKEGSLSLIAEAHGLRRVRELNLRGIEFDESEIAAFVTSPVLSKVKSLELSFCPDRVADQLVVDLAQSPQWNSLNSLDLSYRDAFTDRSLIAIANSPYLKNLTVLDLSNNKITSEGLVALAQSKLLSQLTELRLNGNQICDDGLIALARSPYLRKLQKLALYSNRLTEQSSDAVAQSPLHEIRVLALTMRNFHGGFMVDFVRAPGADEWPEDLPGEW